MKRVLTILMIVGLFFCLACGVGFFLFGRGALRGVQAISRTGEQFLSRLQAGDFQAAAQLIAPSARATYTEAELRKRWRLLENAIGKAQEWSVHDFKIYADTGGMVGNLRMRVQGIKGSGTVDFVLKPEGEQWLITELRFGW